MSDDLIPDPECRVTCWCRNDDPDPAGAMRWTTENVPADRLDEQQRRTA